MALLMDFHPFLLFLLTLILFQGHVSFRQLKLEVLLKFEVAFLPG